MARKRRKRDKRNETYAAYIFPFGLDAKTKAMVVYSPFILEGFIGKRKEKNTMKLLDKGLSGGIGLEEDVIILLK